jgi:hypothetical protein
MEVYAEKFRQLEKTLNDPAIRNEAAGVLRSQISAHEYPLMTQSGHFATFRPGTPIRLRR